MSMKGYDEKVDGPRPGFGYKLGLAAIGWIVGWVGVLAIDWPIGRRKHRMECSAEAIYLGIWGWSLGIIIWFVLTAAGALAPTTSLLCIVAVGWIAVFLGMGGVTFPSPAPIDGWAIFVLVGACLFLFLSSLWVYGLRYKMTDEEAKRSLHGDEWVKPDEPHLRYDGGITIDAEPSKIWPYVRQCGQTRAGWYSFDWLERLFTFKIHNHYDVHPEWQELEPGTYQWFHQPPLSIGEWVTEASNDGPWYFASHSDTATDPTYKNPGPNQEKALGLWFKRFCWTWNWEVYEVEGQPGRSRLVWRCDCTFERYHRANKYFVVFILGTASLVMGRNFLDTMKKLCEGRLVYGENKR